MKTLILLLIASTTADAYYTHRNEVSPRCRETNPLAREFVKHTAGQIGFFTLDTTLTIAASHLLTKHHHRRAGQALLLEEIAQHTAGTAYSASHPERRKP